MFVSLSMVVNGLPADFHLFRQLSSVIVQHEAHEIQQER